MPRSWIAGLTALYFVGCAGVPADRGLGDVLAELETRGRKVPSPSSADPDRLVDALLAAPLTVDGVLAVALARNAVVTAGAARLGIVAADLYDSGRLSNPTLSAAIQHSDDPDASSRVAVGLSQSVLDMLALSARRGAAHGEFDRAQALTAHALLQFAADVETAYYKLVGTSQVASMRQIVAHSAEASAELARRFYDAGNINELQLRREEAAASQARLDSIRAGSAAASARVELNRLMGLPAGAVWSIEARLPMPVAEEDDLAALQRLAAERRLDLAAARRGIEAREMAVTLASRTRWLDMFDLGVEYERDTDGSQLVGPSLGLSLPISRRGSGALARERAGLELAHAELAAVENDISNSVHAAHENVIAVRELVRRYQAELVPLRQSIVARMQELQNYMIIGQFELIAAKQDEYDAYEAYLEAVRDYWLSRVALTRQVGTRLPSQDTVGEAVVAPIPLAPEAPPPSHGRHHH